LPLNLRYVGLVGPRKRRDQLQNALLDVSVAINAGFFAPAGLDLGAETPEEITLTIVSEIQRVFAKSSGESLHETKISIHSVNRESTRSSRFKPNVNCGGIDWFGFDSENAETQRRRAVSRIAG
jgi:hypothetical protein